jgi:hypothetical protein
MVFRICFTGAIPDRCPGIELKTPTNIIAGFE